MDGFFVAKFKVCRRKKVGNGGDGEANGGGNDHADMGNHDHSEKPTFNDDEDKSYIEGLSSHNAYVSSCHSTDNALL